MEYNSTFEFYIDDVLLLTIERDLMSQKQIQNDGVCQNNLTRIEVIDIHWIMEECWIEKLQLILSNIFWVLNFAKKEPVLLQINNIIALRWVKAILSLGDRLYESPNFSDTFQYVLEKLLSYTKLHNSLYYQAVWF